MVSKPSKKPATPRQKETARMAARFFSSAAEAANKKDKFISRANTDIKIPAKELPLSGATAANPIVRMGARILAGSGGLIGTTKVKKTRPSESSKERKR